MSHARPALPSGVTGRADLLRLLATAPRDALMLDHDASGWFGYVCRLPPVIVRLSPAVGRESATLGRVTALRERKAPLKLPFIHALVRRETRPPRNLGVPIPADWEQAGYIEEADAQSPSDRRLIDYEDLVPQARLMPALRRLLGASRPGPLDLDRLTEQVAANRLPRHLPRRMSPRWHPDLIVVLDFCSRLWPYRWDMHRLARRLLRQVGRTSVSLRIVNHGPLGPWSDWLAEQGRALLAVPPQRLWAMPPAGTPVLIVSDLGLLLGPSSATARAWSQFVEGLVRAQVRPLALVPLGAAQLGEPVPSRLPVLRWSPDARPHPIPVRGTAVAEPEGIDDLLAMVSATRRVDPPLLRAMRRLNPRAPHNAGLEGAVWCHRHVEAVHTASIRAEAREAHLRRFTALLPELQAEVETQRDRHHCHLRALINHEEALLWESRVDPSTLSPGAKERRAGAQTFFRKLAASLTQPDPRAAAVWKSVAEGIVQRADAAMEERCHDALYPLLAALKRTQGEAAVLPDWVVPARLAAAVGGEQTAQPRWLVRDAASGRLVLQALPAGIRQSSLVDHLLVDDGGVRMTVYDAGSSRPLSVATLPAVDEPATVGLETSRESILVAPAERPLGALGWGCDQSGIVVYSPPFGRWEMRWSGEALRPVRHPDAGAAGHRWALEADGVLHPEADGALRFGIDRRFGVYADLLITTGHGSAIQRLRWIPPGMFLMGSPETEAGRLDNEGPRHEVTISAGFWLFDTACTQALWQAVMGDNPSAFKSPDRPVENVSWDDIRGFLDRINALVPGLDLVLPTEAEWEYACRAGTGAAIYAGDLQILGKNNAPALDPIAWYGGNSGVDFDLDSGWESSNWPEKQYPHTQAGTRPVGLKRPNVWGLHDMLGNVWEWCADGRRSYTAEAATDPAGPTDPGAFRVLRGGSWYDGAQDARSAFRFAYLPGYRDDLGFRCARVQEGRELTSGPEARAKKRPSR